jgi:hypothetical protein
MQVTTASSFLRFSFNLQGGRHDNTIINCPGSSAGRRIADMAVQFGLGLFPKRDYRINCRCTVNPVFDGPVINLNHSLGRLRIFCNRFRFSVTFR